MIKARVEYRRFWLLGLVIIAIILTGFVLIGCQLENSTILDGADTQNATATPSPPATQDQSEEQAPIVAPTNFDGYQPVWGTFSPPGLDPATPIPEPLSGLEIPDEVQVWVLLGSDTEPPFTGRIQAIHLIFHPPPLLQSQSGIHSRRPVRLHSRLYHAATQYRLCDWRD